MITGFFTVIHVLLLFVPGIPRALFAVNYLFWRLAYNLGIGLLLKAQSEARWFEKATTYLRVNHSESLIGHVMQMILANPIPHQEDYIKQLVTPNKIEESH